MDTIKYHVWASVETFAQLFKGRYLLFFIPGAVMTIVYFYFLNHSASVEESMLLKSEYSWIDWALSYVNTWISAVFGVFDFILEQIYIFVVITILSPFNTLLGEKLDKQLTGRTFKTTFMTFINDILRMIFVVFMAIMMELILFGTYWLFSWMIDNENVDKVVYFCISAFFFGFAFYDFALERYKINVFRSIGFAFSKPLAMIITGSIFLLLYKIPYIGIPISPVITVMVSTIVYLYLTKKLNKRDQKLQEIEND